MTGDPVLVGGRYALEERLAAGGMGEVWRARDVGSGAAVAVKVLRPGADDADRARFRDEALHASALTGPGLAQVHDWGEDAADGRAWIAMELVDGEPLSALLAREAPLPVERTLDLLDQAARALAVVHAAGVVHRDVKPGNLMLRRDGVLKVTDFGVARLADSSTTSTGLVVGTAAYLSPEQAGGRPSTPASDVYALGVVAHECLTGRRPFDGSPAEVTAAHLHDPPPPLPGSVPPPLRALVGSALSKDPADRPADAAAFAEALAGVRSQLVRPRGRRLHLRGLRLALPLVAVFAVALLARSVLAGADRLVRVPALVGLPAATALEQARDAGLVPAPRSTAAPGRPAGSVVATSPSAGTRLHRGDRVAVQVATEAALLDLVGVPFEQAEAALGAQGRTLTVRYDATGAPAGTVAWLEGAADTRSGPGSEVVVHVVPARDDGSAG